MCKKLLEIPSYTFMVLLSAFLLVDLETMVSVFYYFKKISKNRMIILMTFLFLASLD